MRYLAIGLAIVAVVVICMSVFYINTLKTSMAAETDRYLTETSQHVSAMVEYKVQSTLQSLQAMAVISVNLQDSSAVMNYLRRMSRLYGYVQMNICTQSHESYSTTGEKSNMISAVYVRKALGGTSTVSNLLQSSVNGEANIVYAVPIWSQGTVVGALTACSDKTSIGNFLNMTSFQGAGFSQIVNRNGDFVVRSENRYAVPGVTNFFEYVGDHGEVDKGCSLATMQQDLAAGKSGMLYFQLEDGIHKAMTYSPLNVGDWYLLSVVPTSVAGENTTRAIQLSMLITSVIFILFLLLIVLIFLLQRGYEKRLEVMAFVDPVTGGFNRERFATAAMAQIAAAPPGFYVLVSLDIQQFKLINDMFGSELGNRTLQYVYDVIQRCLQGDELVSRISADNFHLLLRNSDAAALTQRLGRMVEDINSFNLNLVQKYYLSIALGVYVIEEPTLNIISIQDRANTARKNQKGAPSHHLTTCAFYTVADHQRMVREKEMDNRMEAALAQGEFVVYLQPKVSLTTNLVAGAEALARWQDPKNGLLLPKEFIPFFEKNGFILTLDLYIFEETCKLLRRWLDLGRQPLPISFNLSRLHFRQPDFLAPFLAILQQYQVPAHLLEIEITETVVFENMSALIEIMTQIHQEGFLCSLDDFGSGYSSLNILKEVPTDILKLDRAFFGQKDGLNERSCLVIESVIQLAKKLQMRTVAEGVETAGQVEFLRQAHCDLVQGYFFAKPLPIAEFEAFAFPGE